ADELRGCDSSVLFRDWKEELVVQRELYTSTQEISDASPLVRGPAAAPGEGLTVACVDNLDEFNAIQPEWDDLVERSDADRVFVSHVWLRTWWECFGSGRKLYIILVRSGARLIGAAPLMQTSGYAYGVPLRRLESIYNHHTPRFDFPIAARHHEV